MGNILLHLLSKHLIPITFSALPHITGAISPVAQPSINPLYISWSLNSPSLKYLSSNSSLFQLQLPLSFSYIHLSLSNNSSGTSISFISLVFVSCILAFLEITFITPLKSSSIPIGY